MNLPLAIAGARRGVVAFPYLGFLAAVLVCAPALGQSAAGHESGGHAWMVLTRDPSRAAVLHLPPRRIGEDRPTVRIARWFAKAPERVGWYGADVWFVFGPEEGGATGLQRPVLRIAAVRGIAGGWDYEPSERPTALPSLPGRMDLLGFVGCAAGPVALVREGHGFGDAPKTNAGTLRLMALAAGGWKPLRAPWDSDAGTGTPGQPGARMHLVSTATGIGILSVGDADLTWWTGGVKPAKPGDVAEVSWEEHSIPLGACTAEAAAHRAQWVYWVDGQVLGIAYENGRLLVTAVRPSGLLPLGEVSGVAPDYRLVPIVGKNILTVLWEAAGAEKPGVSARYQFVDISASSGRELFRGPASMPGPVSRNEIRLLTIGLIGVMAAVLFFVLRPGEQENRGESTALPTGFAPAGIGRRWLAAGVDCAIALGAAVLVVRWGAGQSAGSGWVHVPVAMVLGWVVGTMSEALTGRTVGKRLAGCRVVVAGQEGSPGNGEGTSAPGAAPSARRIGLRRAALRNALKWVVPFGLASGLGRNGRHLGDVAAGTVVVARERG